jgi:hypothetical protein
VTLRRLLPCLAALAIGCRTPAPRAVPGDTTIAVSSVTIEARDGDALAIDYAPLVDKLGLSAADGIVTTAPRSRTARSST